MGNESSWSGSQCLSTLNNFFRKYLFRVLSCGAIPTHIAFIMDGNRRFAKKQNMVEGEGHRAGYKSLISMLNYCYELGVKYITVYAFSIENFKRKPEEVQYLMDLMIEKIDELLREGSIVNQYGMRLYFIGNLKLLSEEVRTAAEKAMKATAHNSRTVLLICVAYTSYDEIVHAVQESCEEKMNNIQAENTSKAGRNSTEQNGSCEKMNGVHPHEIQDCHKREVHGTVILGKNEICCNGFSKLEASEKKNGVIKRAVPGFKGEKWNEVQQSMQSQLSKGTIESGEDGETIQEIKPLLSKGTIESGEDGETIQEIKPLINLVDIEKHMYMAVAPDPDIVIRSSGGDSSEQLPAVADWLQSPVLSGCAMARDRAVAFGGGGIALPAKLLVSAEEEETVVRSNFSHHAKIGDSLVFDGSAAILHFTYIGLQLVEGGREGGREGTLWLLLFLSSSQLTCLILDQFLSPC